MNLKTSDSRTYAAGETVFREDEEAGYAYLIRSGTVDILKQNSKGREVCIAVLEAGEIFGEMGLIFDHPRSATVRAHTDLVVDVIDSQSFKNLFDEECGRRLRPLIQIMSERLRQASARLAEVDGDGGKVFQEKVVRPTCSQVRLVADTPEAQTALAGRDWLEISRFPFLVGRQCPGNGEDLFQVNDLYLCEGEPHTVSRSHFGLFCKDNRCYLQDRGSRHGCIVNGKRVGGGYRNVAQTVLVRGENSLCIGKRDANLCFTVVVSGKIPERESFWSRFARGFCRLARFAVKQK